MFRIEHSLNLDRLHDAARNFAKKKKKTYRDVMSGRDHVNICTVA